MTRFTITTGRKRGDYVLRDTDGREEGLLRAGWTLRRVQITSRDGAWAVRRQGWQHVEVEGSDGLVVSLDPGRSTVPGPGPDAAWSTDREGGGWHGSLRRGGAQINVRLTAPRARQGEVSVTGEWEQLDLVVLAACFALVLRHRRRAVVVAGGAA